MNENRHSKLPWRLSRYHYPHSEIVFDKLSDDNDSRAKLEGRLICSLDGQSKPTGSFKADAELIVTAVNSYADNQKLIGDLVDGLELLRSECNCYLGSADKYEDGTYEQPSDFDMYVAVENAESLIAKAEKK